MSLGVLASLALLGIAGLASFAGKDFLLFAVSQLGLPAAIAILFGLGFFIWLRSLGLSAVAALALFYAQISVEGIFGWAFSILTSLSHMGWTQLNEFLSDAAPMSVIVGAGVMAWQLRLVAAEVCEGATAQQAARIALRKSLTPGVLAFLIAISIALTPLARLYAAEASLEAAEFEILSIAAILASAVAGMLATFGLLPLLVTYLSLGETFIERTNRLRERYARFLQPFDGLGEPRWALSMAGCSTVLLALVFFDRTVIAGHKELAVWTVWRLAALPLVLAVAIVALIGLAYLKNARLAAAWILSTLYLSTISVWLGWHLGRIRIGDIPAFTGFDEPRNYPGWELIASYFALIACVSLLFARSVAVARRTEEPSGACRTALRETADTIIFIGLLFTFACLLSPSLFVPSLSLAAALLVLPAMYIGLETLLPRYRSADEVFGKH